MRFSPSIAGWACCALLLGTGALAAQTSNRVSDPSFEETMINGLPGDWELFCPVAPDGSGLVRAGRAAFASDGSVARSGQEALRISSSEPTRCAILQRGIPCQPGEPWQFSVWMKGANLDIGNDTGALARVSFLNAFDPSQNAALARKSSAVRSEDADFDWRKFQASGTVPAGATVAQVELFLWKGKGTVWFDDVALDFGKPARLPDRAAKQRFRSADAKLAGQPKVGPRVVFMGDSITEGWHLETCFPGENFVNRGIGGQLTWQMVERFPQDVLDLQPATVVILAGTNDIGGAMPADTIVANIRAMIQACRAAHVKVVLCSILPVTDALATPEKPQLVRTVKRPPQVINAINGQLRQIAGEEKVTFLDLHQALVDRQGSLPAGMTVDGLHLNPRGYEVISPLVLQAIRAAGND